VVEGLSGEEATLASVVCVGSDLSGTEGWGRARFGVKSLNFHRPFPPPHHHLTSVSYLTS
jgi:hypothetical protein